MSKKVSIGLSVVLFVALAALIVCERAYPGAGVKFLNSIFH
jgi:hypothetical protein